MFHTARAKRTWPRIAALAAAFAMTGMAPALAQDKYPAKPIRWVIGFPAGGGTDFLARTVANAMSEQMGQPILIDNRPGASAMIGADIAARAPADGYTLWTGDMSTLVFNPMVYRKISYKVSDFQPVGMMGRFNLVVATSTSTGIDTLAGAVDAVRKGAGKYSYGSVGAGTPHHFVMELFKKSAGVELTHVPYRGVPPMVQDLMGGQVQFAPIDAAIAQTHVKAGKLKPLAVTSRARLPGFPQVPTMLELGYKEVEMYAWQGLLVHADTPRPIVDLLAANLQKALQRADVKKALLDYGLEVTPSTPQEFAAYIDQQTKTWSEIVRASGVKLDM
jgi:tripartite-type tricarboxylate transporter receptor subunit TctC